jgi:hypothetical protein
VICTGIKQQYFQIVKVDKRMQKWRYCFEKWRNIAVASNGLRHFEEGLEPL